jgi:serine/threonine protein kinase
MLGYGQIGKLVSIYSRNDVQSLQLANKLIDLTSRFKGPAIPSAVLLKGIVYASHAHYDADGDHSYRIPFMVPEDVSWPFYGFDLPTAPVQKKLWNDRYRPLSILKNDFKGRVIKGNYFKSLFNIQLCVIKEGVQHIWSDQWGRDVIDRLKWQYEIYSDLAGEVNTPRIFDYFTENGNAYLVMEFIKGDSLNDKIENIHSGNNWESLTLKDKYTLIDYLLSVIDVVKKLHQKGYVHRDITPANFIIDRKGKVYLIDMELTYSIKLHKPNPAFRLGTPGYASPQQLAHREPTVKEDIYGLGALMIQLFTGLSPIKFGELSVSELLKSVLSLTGDRSLSSLIAACLHELPEERPALDKIQNNIEDFRHRLSSLNNERFSPISKNELDDIINGAIRGLVNSRWIGGNLLLTSLKDPYNTFLGYQPVERDVQLGLDTGITGVMYLLAKAKNNGYDISPCIGLFTANMNYMQEMISHPDSNIPMGLFSGLAGIGLAIQEGIDAGLITNDSYKQRLKQCFINTSPALDLANGVAGQIISFLKCKELMEEDFWLATLKQYVKVLCEQQQPDGSWNLFRGDEKKNDKILGLANGMAGILYSLIKFAEELGDESISKCIQKGLNWVIKMQRKKANVYFWNTSTKSKSIDKCRVITGVPGVALVFIKAYSLYNEPLYKTVAENALLSLQSRPVFGDFTLGYGLSGLGEVYLEASRVFKTKEWYNRAEWIANLFANTFQNSKSNAGYWSINSNPDPEPDLITGCGGLINFLIRYQRLNQL